MTDQEQHSIFEEWLGQFKPMLVKIVRAFAFTRADQQDLFQEISLQVWNSVPSFRQASSVSTWIYRVALNTSIKWSQKEKKHRRVTEPVETLEPILRDPITPMDDRLLWLYEQIAKLNYIDRSLTLLMLDGLSYREMAIILGITESNVGVKINRIKTKLSEQSKHITHGS